MVLYDKMKSSMVVPDDRMKTVGHFVPIAHGFLIVSS